MSASNPTAQESAVTSVAQIPDNPSVDDLANAVKTLTQEVTQLRDENERLRDELADERETRAKADAEIRSRLTEVEETVESQEGTDLQPDSDHSNPGGNESKTTVQEPQTALGDCVTLPEPVANDNLSANQSRARSVAKDIVDYGRSVPAGYAITSSELRTVLTALRDDAGRTYTATVSRTIDYLDDLGADQVHVDETMSGERVVIFDDEFVRRTVAWRQSETSNSVVSEGGAVG